MSALLVWCARWLVNPDDAGPAPVNGFKDDDWRHFMHEALRHSCMPIAARALVDVSGVPDVVRSDLAHAFDANAVRNLRLSGELITATRNLAAAGIESVSWKGPLLAERAYGDLRLRQFFDLDVLVRSADLPRATTVLAKLGFLPQLSLKPHQQAAYVDHMGELELVRESDGLWVELHTAIVATYFDRHRSTAEMWRRVRTARLARADIPALDPVDEFEALCVHGSKHLWERLEWIVDIAMLGRLLDTGDWQRLLSATRRRGTRRMVFIGVLLAADLCEARLPARVIEMARADPVARRLSATAASALFAPDTSRAAELRFHIQMWDRRSDRVRYVANVITTPSVADWEFVELPGRAAALYPLIRPVRMGHDAWRAWRDGGGLGASDPRR